MWIIIELVDKTATKNENNALATIIKINDRNFIPAPAIVKSKNIGTLDRI